MLYLNGTFVMLGMFGAMFNASSSSGYTYANQWSGNVSLSSDIVNVYDNNGDFVETWQFDYELYFTGTLLYNDSNDYVFNFESYNVSATRYVFRNNSYDASIENFSFLDAGNVTDGSFDLNITSNNGANATLSFWTFFDAVNGYMNVRSSIYDYDRDESIFQSSYHYDVSLTYGYTYQSYTIEYMCSREYGFDRLMLQISDAISSNQDIAHNLYLDAYDTGFEAGESVGYQSGYSDGYSHGIEDSLDANTTALTIFNGILNVALVPINFFLAIFNFEVFGINITQLVGSLLSVALVVIVLKVIFGGKSKEK